MGAINNKWVYLLMLNRIYNQKGYPVNTFVLKYRRPIKTKFLISGKQRIEKICPFIFNETSFSKWKI